jgi:hypothetical protein
MSAVAGKSVGPLELQQFFAEVGSRMARAKAPGQLPGQIELARFFSNAGRRLRIAEEQRQQLDRVEATHFNVFRLIEPDENKLSDILADLLDPNGSHGQGGLFLALLLEELGLASVAKSLSTAVVQREATTHGIAKYRRRMDVMVECGVTLAIENKVDALDQADQVKDYLEHLAHCTRATGRPYALVYLTPEGRRPDSLDEDARKAAHAAGRLHCWSYRRELRVWLEACRQQCAARKIQDFLADFVSYIEATMTHNDGPDRE